MCKLYLPRNWLGRQLSILVVGAGGNGSEVIDGLMKMHHAIDINVTLVDDDHISLQNLCRQRFWPNEIGQPKSVSLIHKANMLMGLNWTAYNCRFPLDGILVPDILISCVDNLKTRKEIALHYQNQNIDSLWLDLGNGRDNGQIVLGHLGKPNSVERIANVVDLYPEILTSIDPPERHSCSTVEALSRQDLFINPKIANAGLNLLWQLFRQRELSVNGIIVDLVSMTESPIPIQ